MEKKIMKRTIILFVLVVAILTALDYLNLPSLIGLKVSNINLDFYMGMLNVLVVLAIFIITYKTLDERAIKRDKNKREISVLLINNCYEECQSYMDFLNKEIVEKYIVPKIDFNSKENKIVVNLQNAPFESESVIMDFIKDGQMTAEQIKDYLKIKRKYREYVNIRIIFFDKLDNYKKLKDELSDLINEELEKNNSKF